MTDMNSKNPEENPLDPAENLAERYLATQVARARRSLNLTRIFGMLSVFFSLAYLGWVTLGLQQYLRPVPAAQLANGIILERVSDQGPQLAASIREQLPTLISQIPDYAQQQVPVYREALEDRFQADLTQSLGKSSAQLDQGLDEYLQGHQQEIKQALTAGQDPQATQQLGAEIGQEFLTSLKQTTVNGETVQSKLDASLTSLQQVQKKMDRLANAKDLSPQEKKTRHAIAVMSQAIKKNVPPAPALTAATLKP